MSVSGPGRVIDNGLVLYLDASNNKSIVSGSNTWFDVSRNGNNGTLTNGPTYSSDNNGSIVFDGTNDYMLTTSVANFRSISMFLLKTDTGPSAWKFIIDARPGFDSGWFANQESTLNGWLNWRLNGVSVARNYALLPTNQWFCLYIEAATNYTSTINFMSRYTNNEQMGGRIGQISVYNRALSASEILQNYNLEKKRFGL